MLDFTSALYLGMRHASGSLQPWEQLTTGVPAALAAPAAAAELAQALAQLQGCERAVLAPSTLHLFWDLCGLLGGKSAAIYMDDGLYPVGRWGVERAAARGSMALTFPHHDAASLRALLLRRRGRARPVIVTDGFCPGCARPAPLADYLELARTFGGQLIMDDTQSIGIFGRAPGRAAPYGYGGGGTLRLLGASDENVLVISSLAKGFGVPVATLAGSSAAIRDFEMRSETRIHCSPPSIASLRALSNALAVNRRRGDALRLQLQRLVRYFRALLRRLGLAADGGLFPVQTLAGLPAGRAEELHASLEEYGVRAVLRSDRCRGGPRLSFILNALHTTEMLDLAVCALARAARCAGVSLRPARSLPPCVNV